MSETVYESPDQRAARARGLCGKQMANDMKRRSGCVCSRLAGHRGRCASQFAKINQRGSPAEYGYASYLMSRDST